MHVPVLTKTTPLTTASTRCRLSLSALLLVGLLAGCRPVDDQSAVSPKSSPADTYNNDVALKWSNLHLTLVRHSPGQTPPVSSRTFGYAGVTLYESVVAGIPGGMSLAGQLQGLTPLPVTQPNQPYNWALSANAGQAAVLRELFANTPAADKQRIDSLETALYAEFRGGDEAQASRSVAYGKSIASAIVEWSKIDGGHEGYNRNFPASFVPSTAPGTWRPTENGRTIPMQPYWGKNRTMLAVTSALPIPVPLPISTQVSSPYFAQYLEVYAKNLTLSQQEKELSVWWADDPSETFTPPGHSYNIARIAIRTDKANLGKAAETLARVGIAVMDAFISCWKCKYMYNNERPYTFVRRAIDPNWVPFWPAPPFPGFSSGHSTQSAASAIALTGLYGASFAFTDDSHVGRVRDTKRSVDFKARPFASFWEAAEESAYSRFLGGIHTRQDNDLGLKEGRAIGQGINALHWKRVQ